MTVNRPDGHCGALSSSTASSASGSALPGQAQAADVLVPGRVPAAAGVRVGATLVLVAFDGVRLDRRADVGDDLLGEAAVGGGEGLPLALGRVHRLGEGDALDPVGRVVRFEEVADLAIERDLERVLLDRRLEAALGRWPVRQHDRLAHGGRRRPGDPHGLAGDAVGLGGGQDVARGEAPGTVDEDADPEAFALARRDAFDPSRLDRDALVEPPDDADVRVARAEGRGRVEGAFGQVSHARRSLAEGCDGGITADAVSVPARHRACQRVGAPPTAWAVR